MLCFAVGIMPIIVIVVCNVGVKRGKISSREMMLTPCLFHPFFLNIDPVTSVSNFHFLASNAEGTTCSSFVKAFGANKIKH
jgi:hypothetical protein